MEPLTPEEQQQRAELNRRDAMVRWQQQEDERVARAARNEPLRALIETHDVLGFLDALSQLSPSLDFELRQKMELVGSVMRPNFTATKIRLDADTIATPQPPAPDA